MTYTNFRYRCIKRPLQKNPWHFLWFYQTWVNKSGHFFKNEAVARWYLKTQLHEKLLQHKKGFFYNLGVYFLV